MEKPNFQKPYFVYPSKTKLYKFRVVQLGRTCALQLLDALLETSGDSPPSPEARMHGAGWVYGPGHCRLLTFSIWATSHPGWPQKGLIGNPRLNSKT